MSKVTKSKPDKVNKTPFEFDSIGDNLTDQQKLFCMEYVNNGFNGEQAAISAGYSANSAGEQASRLLTYVNLQEYLDCLKNDLGLRIGISAEKVALEMAKIGFSNVKSIFDEDGSLKPLSEMSDAEAACIAGIEVVELFEGKGDKRVQTGYIKKVKLWDKSKSLSDLNVMLGYNKPTKVANTDVDGKDKEVSSMIIGNLSDFLKK